MNKKKIVFVSDFNFKGSGYLNIAIPLCRGLSDMGMEVKAVGLGYSGEEHLFDFTIIPCPSFSDAHAMVNNLHYQWNPDIVIVALDIPYLAQFSHICKGLGMKMIAITPLENSPLTLSWAYILQEIDKVFMISQFGTEEANKQGVEAEHLVVGMDTKSWRMRTQEEYIQGREMMNISEDTLVVLTVADNQERKNLSKAFEIISKVKNEKKIKVKYILVTRENSDVGWKLRDLAMFYNIAPEVMIFERGLPFKELYSLYAISDAFLLTSKAEGLCCLPSQEVWTQEGVKTIDSLRSGELVISHSGEMQLVEEIFEREVKEPITRINMGFGLDSIEVTDLHMVLGAKNVKRHMEHGKMVGKGGLVLEWLPAHSFTKGDYVFFPEVGDSDTQTICSADYLSGVSDFEINGNLVSPIGRNQHGNRYIHPTGKSLPLAIETSQEFMESLGWYISEGCDTRSGLSFSLHHNEVEFQKRIKELMRALYGVEVVDTFKDRNRYDGRVSHALLGRFYSSMCGDGAHNKKIPAWALYLPAHKQWPMLEALFSGDGTIDFNLRTLRYSTVSRGLAKQIQFILLKLGVVSSFREARGRVEFIVTVSGDELLKVPFVCGATSAKKHQQQFAKVSGGWLFPVRGTEAYVYEGTVYNLEVSNDHSYLLGGGVVHNCMPVMEAMSVGIPVVATSCGALPELLGDGRGFLMETEYSHIDPWGNSRRDFPDAESGAEILSLDLRSCIPIAREYMEHRNWDIPVSRLVRAVEKLDETK